MVMCRLYVVVKNISLHIVNKIKVILLTKLVIHTLRMSTLLEPKKIWLHAILTTLSICTVNKNNLLVIRVVLIAIVM